jgi:hypothetical protein
MRQQLGELGLPMPAWAEIHDAASLDDFIAANGGVAILKTPIGGYDGKGVRVVRSSVDAKDWLENLADFGGSLLAEEKVDFVRELAQLSSRLGRWLRPFKKTVFVLWFWHLLRKQVQQLLPPPRISQSALPRHLVLPVCLRLKCLRLAMDES